jgi:hypothetical protein
MRRIASPQFPHKDVYLACVSGVGDPELRTTYEANLLAVELGGEEYIAKAAIGQLSSLQKTYASTCSDPIVVGDLTKKLLNTLYTNYMVPAEKPARSLYDRILTSADDKCPFCGGIGHPRTLDHYLPKAKYPLYSVLPVNLVPCCRDCNTEKNSQAAVSFGEQALHPYLDKDHFFKEQWIVASVLPKNPVALHFSVSSPVHWNLEDQQRVANHFVDYGLAKRYGIEAGRELATLIYLRRGSLKGFPTENFEKYLSDIANDPSMALNSWKRVMYRSLSNDEWFISHQF